MRAARVVATDLSNAQMPTTINASTPRARDHKIKRYCLCLEPEDGREMIGCEAEPNGRLSGVGMA